MPFANPEYWIKHDVQEGTCLKCGLRIPTMHQGPIWVRKSGMRMINEPPGTWKECTPA